jgi:hypothetical protein
MRSPSSLETPVSLHLLCKGSDLFWFGSVKKPGSGALLDLDYLPDDILVPDP